MHFVMLGPEKSLFLPKVRGIFLMHEKALKSGSITVKSAYL